MLNKVIELRDILASEGELPALRFAARLRCLGVYQGRINKAYSAHRNPRLYKEMGDDPKALVADGVAAINELIAEG